MSRSKYENTIRSLKIQVRDNLGIYDSVKYLWNYFYYSKLNESLFRNFLYENVKFRSIVHNVKG